jgi:hypothetical protein
MSRVAAAVKKNRRRVRHPLLKVAKRAAPSTSVMKEMCLTNLARETLRSRWGLVEAIRELFRMNGSRLGRCQLARLIQYDNSWRLEFAGISKDFALYLVRAVFPELRD